MDAIPTHKKRCEDCGKVQLSSQFVSGTDTRDGLNFICNTCRKKYNTLKKLEQFCELDKRVFSIDLWNNCMQKAKSEKEAVTLYFRQMNLPQNKISTQDPKNYEEIQEEKIYNKKWMGYYSQSEIDYLDNYLKGLHGDFKIVTENHKDYAKKIAKASLHMDKCFQEMLKGVNGADKRYKDARETFDTLSKSAQFSENSRGQNDVSLGSFGVTFDRVEQKKWIPKHTPLVKDDYDKLIDYFSTIYKSV